jgi:hypothetical protein
VSREQLSSEMAGCWWCFPRHFLRTTGGTGRREEYHWPLNSNQSALKEFEPTYIKAQRRILHGRVCRWQENRWPIKCDANHESNLAPTMQHGTGSDFSSNFADLIGFFHFIFENLARVYLLLKKRFYDSRENTIPTAQ